MMTTPTFRYDKQFLEEGIRGKEAFQLPPGPNSPIGIIWNGISKSGIGLHGTASPKTIGRSQSAGCVRFANWDAIRLPSLVRPGAKVIVR
jgi:lipoprotein-anchoring transpeptidase ErfK/SrfK